MIKLYFYFNIMKVQLIIYLITLEEYYKILLFLHYFKLSLKYLSFYLLNFYL